MKPPCLHATAWSTRCEPTGQSSPPAGPQLERAGRAWPSSQSKRRGSAPPSGRRTRAMSSPKCIRRTGGASGTRRGTAAIFTEVAIDRNRSVSPGTSPPNLQIRRFLYLHPALSRSVRDLGLVSLRCPDRSGAPEGCSSVWLPLWLLGADPRPSAFQAAHTPKSLCNMRASGHCHRCCQHSPRLSASVDLTCWPGMQSESDSSRVRARPGPLLANPLARSAGGEALQWLD